MFEIGQKVVCINGKPMRPRKYPDETHPTEGQIYTIRNVGNVLCDAGVEPAVRLEEIVNTPRLYRLGHGVDGMDELWFRASRFAPIKKTDISIFLKMLEPVKEKV